MLKFAILLISLVRFKWLSIRLFDSIFRSPGYFSSGDFHEGVLLCAGPPLRVSWPLEPWSASAPAQCCGASRRFWSVFLARQTVVLQPARLRAIVYHDWFPVLWFWLSVNLRLFVHSSVLHKSVPCAAIVGLRFNILVTLFVLFSFSRLSFRH